MRVLIDTDVVLDLVLKRAAFYADAFALWQAGDQGRYERYIAAMTPINAYYIARKMLGAADARQAIGDLLAATRICAIDDQVVRAALGSATADFEDAVQIAAALHTGLNIIVTRNTDDYTASPIPVLTPAQFLTRLASPSQEADDD
ncbi:PIN domain-containing protein [Oscillochloris sp. ZM17-4]|uniref:type II toxin-antitoxin system VapC family toxin n=1 Tax=Oscillochloris sp. ZM17-4 TaxID=2866714 RepID=UPI001C73D64F|nr:PIN domain-containing protein [Oscillochloris sp. ZM17-4]MBX0331249.1 PIN domain-containing protein [Oscillochloris sp. ZM17-4]